MREYKHIIILFIITFCYAALTAFTGLNTYDEGILLTGGFRVLNGDIPHSNFSSLYPAGSYYFIAPFIAIFKNTLLISRLLASLFFAFNCVYIFLFTKRILAARLAPLAAWISAVLWCGIPSTSLRAVFIALFCALSSLYIFTSVSIPHKRKTILSFILLLLCSLFRWDIAFYCGAGLSLYYALHKSQHKTIAFTSALIIFTFISLIFPLFFVFLMGGEKAFYAAWQQSILFPILDFPKYRQLPLPFFFPRWNGESRGDVILSTLSFWGILLTIFLTLFQILRKKGKELFSAQSSLIVTLTFFTLCLFNQARVRTDFEHTIPALFTGFILLYSLMFKQQSTEAKSPLQKLPFIVFCIIILIPLPFKIKQLMEVKEYSSFQTGTLQGISYKNATNYDRLITFITKRTKPSERIFVCPSEGNSGTSCDILLYYASQRLPATQWHEFHPGITSQESIQNRIISDLKQNNCRLIIRQSVHPSLEPNLSSTAKPSTVLDTYIREHYHTMEKVDTYTILTRNETTHSN